MNTPQQQFCNGDYLDVTEFILKEHNPDDSEDSSNMPTIQIVVEVCRFFTVSMAPVPFGFLTNAGRLRHSRQSPTRTRSFNDITLVEGIAPRRSK
jgi:hypothetical protein